MGEGVGTGTPKKYHISQGGQQGYYQQAYYLQVFQRFY